MSKGRITIPTDSSFVEGTKKYVEMWGADAVRDCDGTELPENVSELAEKVYKTYFVSRGDNDYAYSHDEYLQNIALITTRHTATKETLEIDLMEGFFDEQVRVNPEEHKKYWQVFDRTSGEEISSWEYLGNNLVRIHNAKKYHEYTVNFFGKNLWNSTQIYNYTCNGWTITKDRDVDPIFPEAFDKILENMETWLKNHPQVNVVRFTTFFYHFFLLFYRGDKQKLFDWYNYAMSASPSMFKRFEKEYGYEIKLEDLLTEGSYANQFHLPTKARLDYWDMVQRFVSEKMAKIIEKVHEYGKEAMMFWGDNWMGAEPFGKYFEQMKLDAVVGSASSGTTVRAVSDLTSVRYKEIRLNPYFFPDTLADEEIATRAMQRNWVIERRAILRKPIDRIGFGGYLKLADRFPKLCKAIEEICEDFRSVYDVVSKGEPYNVLKVAILSYWGKEKSWMTNMTSQDAPYPRTEHLLGFLESLSGLPVDISFISFEEAKQGKLKEFDVVFNCGNAGTSFSGGECWKDESLVVAVREYVAEGGGFIGIGDPSAYEYGGRYFQLADVLGVDKEMAKSMLFNRYNNAPNRNHFITEELTGEFVCTGADDHVYALDSSQILDSISAKAGNCHVKLACNCYYEGRSVYMAGLIYNAENTRLLYRAMLWCARKESELKKCFSTNINVECNYYPIEGKYALVNNTSESQTTDFYDKNGVMNTYIVPANKIVWIEE